MSISIQDLKKIVETSEYQALIKQLSQEYYIDIYNEMELQLYNIISNQCKFSDLSIDEIHQFFLENQTLVCLYINDKFGKPEKEKGVTYLGFPQTIFLTSAMEILLIEKNKLLDYVKKQRVIAPTKCVKEDIASYQRALATSKNEPIPEIFQKKPKEEKVISYIGNKIILGEFKSTDEDDKWQTSAILWEKETEINIIGDYDSKKAIVNYVQWIENNRETILSFALEYENFLDTFNDWISEEIRKKGKATLYDKTILTEPITEEELTKGIHIEDISIFLEDGSIESAEINLITSPDYFNGHNLVIEANKKKKLAFGGMQG
ncbi:hypothetical protein CAPN001_05440 [Capnocytophaga stomatis]|uniref:DUF2262 domain-containing protein n=1 Tax=Capnocytophaga stomatis TaxID=1848904 RepID=UPI001950FDB2|nr:DUF2262 domain-containing protein [Capnocytophaga stomatis]GIJ95975.1 hypothetical protein CAPN001_05440 [Capnocytophaga stomatis]GIM49812.1 hypothetical protein CAPN003_12640 [Capnocytophaga stomatis]